MRSNQSKGESSILSRIMSNQQAVHNSVAASSAGMAILRLSNDFLGQYPSESKVNDLYNECISSLEITMVDELKSEGIAADKIKPLVNFMIAKTKEPTDEWDVVTLYLPEEKKEVVYLLPLKYVLPLVWKANTDLASYPQDPSAEQNRRKRILTLFHTFERIKAGICHLGVRFELIMSLNGVYKDLSLIEDPSA